MWALLYGYFLVAEMVTRACVVYLNISKHIAPSEKLYSKIVYLAQTFFLLKMEESHAQCQ